MEGVPPFGRTLRAQMEPDKSPVPQCGSAMCVMVVSKVVLKICHSKVVLKFTKKKNGFNFHHMGPMGFHSPHVCEKKRSAGLQPVTCY